MNYSFSSAQGTNESLDQFGSECLHSVVWYQFILTTALVYYAMVVMSMIFTKESRRLREISLLHDNLIIFIMLPALIEWFGFTSENSTAISLIHPSTPQKIQYITCSSIVFLHSSLQASFVFALAYTIYAENILLPNMTSIKPMPICNIRLLVWQVTIGLTVATATVMTDSSSKEDSTNECCLHLVSAGRFARTIDLTFDISSIYAAYNLLRVSTDRFLKLIVTARQKPSFMIFARLQVL